MSILLIGDIHFKINNSRQTLQLEEQVVSVITSRSVKHVILLGDVMNEHEKLFTCVMNRVVRFVTNIIKLCPITILVGNHDMINNQVFCDKNGHWMNIFSGWRDVTIVDEPMALKICGLQFCCVPYVFAGRFREALDSYKLDPNTFNYVVAHQEFRGAMMGRFESKSGDEYIWNTLCLSGHVHDFQVLGNVMYTGAAFEQSFGSSSCWLFLINQKNEIEKISSLVDGKRVVYRDLVNGSIDINIGLRNIQSDNKCIIRVDNVDDYHRWLISKQGVEISKKFMIGYTLKGQHTRVFPAIESHNLIECFKTRVMEKYPYYCDLMNSILEQ